MFKVGDKVVRKAADRKGLWSDETGHNPADHVYTVRVGPTLEGIYLHGLVFPYTPERFELAGPAHHKARSTDPDTSIKELK